jgi:hypothetical protein
MKYKMSNSIDSKQFWEDKILTWEDGRYGEEVKAGSWLERIANRASGSLRFRLTITKELLASHVKGKHIVELGCGSGFLAGGTRHTMNPSEAIKFLALVRTSRGQVTNSNNPAQIIFATRQPNFTFSASDTIGITRPLGN